MRRAAWLVIALQVLALLWVAGEREWIRSAAPTVWLRTAPVDPRDPFRGDYVQLDYDIGALSKAQREALGNALASKRSVVYAALSDSSPEVAELVSIGTEPPASGPFIRGHLGTAIDRDWWRRGDVAYGIEKLFVEQGKGLDIEAQRGERDDWQTPMEVEVAVSGRGTAVIRGYRWSPLGIRLEVLTPGDFGSAGTPAAVDAADAADAAAAPAARRSALLRISLRNQGGTELGFLDDPQHCAWQMLDVSVPGWTEVELNRDCSGWVQRAELHRLAPGAVYQFDVDLAQPAWWLKTAEGARELGDAALGWSVRRFLYTPPPTEAIGLPADAPPLWRSALRTAQFNANGRVD